MGMGTTGHCADKWPPQVAVPICRALAAARCWDAGDPWGLWHLHCALGADNPTRPSKLLRRADRLVIMVCLPHGKWGTNWFSEQHPRLPTAACVVWCIYSVISSQGLFHPLQSSPVAPASPLTITSRQIQECFVVFQVCW